MTYRLCLSASLLAWMTVASSAQEPVFRAAVRTVALYVTVRDAQHRVLSDLSQEDFSVSVDGRPVVLSVFDAAPKPLTVALLIDIGRFMWSNLSAALTIARAAVGHIAAPDRMAIGTFAVEVALSPDLTSDRTILSRVLSEEIWPSASPAYMAAAIRRTADRIRNEPGLKVLMIIGYGGLGCPSDLQIQHVCGGPQSIREFLLQNDILFVPILPWPPRTLGRSRELIEQPDAHVPDETVDLAEATGGDVLKIAATGDVAKAVGSLLTDLRHSYLLGFDTELDDGREHQVRVRVKRPNVHIHARRSYVVGR